MYGGQDYFTNQGINIGLDQNGQLYVIGPMDNTMANNASDQNFNYTDFKKIQVPMNGIETQDNYPGDHSLLPQIQNKKSFSNQNIGANVGGMKSKSPQPTQSKFDVTQNFSMQQQSMQTNRDLES